MRLVARPATDQIKLFALVESLLLLPCQRLRGDFRLGSRLAGPGDEGGDSFHALLNFFPFTFAQHCHCRWLRVESDRFDFSLRSRRRGAEDAVEQRQWLPFPAGQAVRGQIQQTIDPVRLCFCENALGQRADQSINAGFLFAQTFISEQAFQKFQFAPGQPRNRGIANVIVSRVLPGDSRQRVLGPRVRDFPEREGELQLHVRAGVIGVLQ